VVELSASQKQRLGRKQETSLLLVSVDEGEPTSKSGLIVDDILVSIKDQSILDHAKLQEHIIKEKGW
jgi:S1-C subfamily serine protease